MSQRRQGDEVCVSGVGLVTPLGSNGEKTWSRLINGESAVAKNPAGQWEARVYDFSPNGARSRMGDFAILAAADALKDAGFSIDDVRGKNIGCAMSQSKPLVQNMESTLLLSSFFGWSSESVVEREFDLRGPSSNVVAACATGIVSIATGMNWIRNGLCDVVVVGAAESSLTSFYRSGFQQMGVLSADVPRPFDRNRSGFAMGEGAGALVLERASHARARGKNPMVIVRRAVLQQSPADFLRFDDDGSAVERLIKATVTDAAMPGYINAHGTATHLNDLAETRGVKKAFGPRAAWVAMSSTKAATGHLLGAAGAAEAGLAVMALRDQTLPPTINLSTPDPECDLDYVPGCARRASFETAMSLSYGFGGQMGAVLFERIHGN